MPISIAHASSLLGPSSHKPQSGVRHEDKDGPNTQFYDNADNDTLSWKQGP